MLSAGDEGGSGTLWFDRAALERTAAADAVTLPTPTSSAPRQRDGNTAAPAIDGKTRRCGAAIAKRALQQTLTIDLQAVREFGGLEIDWARGLHASALLDRDCRSTARHWQHGAQRQRRQRRRRLASACPNPKRATSALTHARRQHRDVGIERAVHSSDLEFGASRNAFFNASLAKQRRAAAIRAVSTTSRSTGRSSASTATARTGCCPKTARSKSRKGSFSIEPFVRHDGKRLLTWADVTIGAFARRRLSADPECGVEAPTMSS